MNALLYHLGDKAQSLLDAVGAGDALVDLPETPEAAQASPQRLRPGIVHRLDKVRPRAPHPGQA